MSKQVTAVERRLMVTAMHESGHALADYKFDFKIKHVTVIPGEGYAGLTRTLLGLNRNLLEHGAPSLSTVGKWHAKIVSLLAGREAQRQYRPQSLRSNQTRTDLQAVREIVWRLHPDEAKARAVLKYLVIRTKNLVAQRMHWQMVQDLAAELVKKRTMNGDEVVAVFRESLRRQRSEACAMA
jgi:hypothetical protein